MVVKHRKKFRRKRGSRECGWGVVHRGKGQKGGAGNAGSGKKAKCKMPARGQWTIQGFGKSGFKYKGSSIVKVPINLKIIEDRLDSLVAQKKVVLEDAFFIVDLPKIGFNKLLSTGKVTKKMKINVPFASKSAVEKVVAAGGEVTGLVKAK
jgi:large subunit ribosomal protein L15